MFRMTHKLVADSYRDRVMDREIESLSHVSSEERSFCFEERERERKEAIITDNIADNIQLYQQMKELQPWVVAPLAPPPMLWSWGMFTRWLNHVLAGKSMKLDTYRHGEK